MRKNYSPDGSTVKLPLKVSYLLFCLDSSPNLIKGERLCDGTLIINRLNMFIIFMTAKYFTAPLRNLEYRLPQAITFCLFKKVLQNKHREKNVSNFPTLELAIIH